MKSHQQLHINQDPSVSVIRHVRDDHSDFVTVKIFDGDIELTMFFDDFEDALRLARRIEHNVNRVAMQALVSDVTS